MVDAVKDTNYKIIRFTSDLLSPTEIGAIKSSVDKALGEGTTNILFSVSIGSLFNQIAISRLLMQCKETIHSKGGHLMVIEKCGGEKSVFCGMCDSLQIPIYYDMETSSVMLENDSHSAKRKSR
jgi:hypothetical protein